MTVLTVGAAAQAVLVMRMTFAFLDRTQRWIRSCGHTRTSSCRWNPTPLPDVELVMSYRMRDAVEAAGGRPDDLRVQLGQACMRYHLRRYAIARGYRPRRRLSAPWIRW